MQAVAGLVIVWTAVIICWRIMKKIQPESSKLYLAYAACIALVLTLFLASHESWV